MSLLKWFGIILIVMALFFNTTFTFAQDDKKKELWTGTLKDGTVINHDGLKKILAEHKKWLGTYAKEGIRADLSGANLKRANLIGADLQGADLSETNLQGASLDDANFQKANLFRANLIGADLRRTNFQEAELEEVNLPMAGLHGTDFQKSFLHKAKFKPSFIPAPSRMRLFGRRPQMEKPLNFQEADLSKAHLQKTNLRGANLKGADLKGADLQGAHLGEANLHGAMLYGANLKGVIFEIKQNNLPYIPSIAQAENLSLLAYDKLSYALVELRTAFKKFGLRRQEREITYAIKHSGFVNAQKEGNLLAKTEVYLGWFFFDLTCQWGMSPERPLFILIGFIFLFTFFYGYAISAVRYRKDSKDGVYKVWLSERIRDDLGNPAKELLDDVSSKSLWLGFRFSLLSAFNIGWRELNVGNWIARLQPYEYKLQATGWPRTVSGIQSLISVYLLALAVLTYFGRPFESY